MIAGAKKRPYSIMDDQWYTVVLKVLVWPEIYHGKMSYSFPTEQSALRFANGNISTQVPSARVYAPNKTMIALVGNPFAG